MGRVAESSNLNLENLIPQRETAGTLIPAVSADRLSTTRIA
jgi:hypothetical protein